MSAVGGDPRDVVRVPARPAARALAADELAWIAALPCALLTLAAIVLLGPLLGRTLLGPHGTEFWSFTQWGPQPLEHGRFFAGLAGPPLLAALVLVVSARSGLRERVRLAPGTIRALVTTGQAALLAFVLLCFAAQNNIVFSADFNGWDHHMYFKWPTLLVALLAPPLALLAVRRSGAGARAAALLRETPRRRVACLALAALYTVVWMLSAINLDRSIGNGTAGVAGHLLWTMNEPFAVLDGRTPLVDYHAQYGQIWAYLAAVPLGLLSPTIGAYTITMATGTALAMLAVYATFRRLVRSSLVALALYAPFAATAFFMIYGPSENRYGPENLFLLWPIRYAGPFLLAWLMARHVDRERPRRVWVVFAIAGLVVVNNPDFGLAAALATLAGLAAAAPPRSWRAARRLAGQAAGGLLGGIALFALFTLARSGELPRPGLLFEFSRLYGIEGWAQETQPELGLHHVVFLTFAAALVLAAVRVVQVMRGDGERGDSEPLLTGLLAWSGVFGLIASVYWAARAHPLALFDFFAPWAFTLVLLGIVVTRALAARGWRRPALPELMVLFGVGLMLCSLPQTPAPGPQIDRIANLTPAPVYKQLEGEQLIRETTRRGEKVAILTALSHRIAYDLGLVNVSPYTSIESIPTRPQLDLTIAIVRREGATKIYVETRFTHPEQIDALEAAGYEIVRYDAKKRYAELVDRAAG